MGRSFPEGKNWRLSMKKVKIFFKRALDLK